ncbi:hypothetical protein CPLU01_00639 [Colletotrichum plurivorum]|uniref:Uncharacterized protein n=1 Tax=Colletotrichum plurivorum TaxID=2175906 RepID=A0A8H6U570_9PEZI|nr:hypothetical protein CPLU01_00639 [Colletotrichum plurivorum]
MDELNHDVEDITGYIDDIHRAPCNSTYNWLVQVVADASNATSHCFDAYIFDINLAILNQMLHDYATATGPPWDWEMTRSSSSQAHIHLINETKFFSELIDKYGTQEDWSSATAAVGFTVDEPANVDKTIYELADDPQTR